MKKIESIIEELLNLDYETEWLEFKENVNDPNMIGEYISALSNSAAIHKKEFGYLIWGIDDISHKEVGTKFDFQKDVKNEPLEHFLARQISPSIAFQFYELKIKGIRVVVLEIPAAFKIPTAYKGVRYLRIGSSKVNLSKYPEREAKLFVKLQKEEINLQNKESEYQNLTFERLFTYYAGKGIKLNPNNFKKNLFLLTKDGNYNLLAQLLSDNSYIPIRVSIFTGKDKSSPLFSIKEFGNTCLLISLEKILEYGDIINLIQVDEKDRTTTRNDVPLFDHNAFREAVINAFVHNRWVDGNGPMITVYNDRVEILSRGALPNNQTKEGFFLGESIPVNQKLSDIFLQLRISERSGRGVPKIVEVYGRETFEFRENSIVVNIPFNRIRTNVGDKARDKVGDKPTLNETQAKMLLEIRNNPNVTHEQLGRALNLKRTAIQNNISFLRNNGYIKRIGSNKSGYWEVLK
ncbi:MAG: RNA-binding domain-containing protein [Acholeplasmataceae bacterium]